MPTDAQKQPAKPSAMQLDVLRYLAESSEPYQRWVKVWHEDTGALGCIALGGRQGYGHESLPVNRHTFRALVERGYIHRPHAGMGGIDLWYITADGRRAVEEANRHANLSPRPHGR